MAKWRVTVEFTEDGEDNYDDVEVDARTESLACEMAVTRVQAEFDPESIDDVEAVLL